MSIATRITNAFYGLASWAVIKYASRYPYPHLLLVDATYKEIERKAQRVTEVNKMIRELEDTSVTLREAGDHIEYLLYTKYKESKYQLLNQMLAEHLALDAIMAEAIEALVAANEDYEASIEDARDRLGIEVYE